MERGNTSSWTDTLGWLSEADRKGRAVRVTSRRTDGGEEQRVGRAVGYRLDHDGRSLVLLESESQTDAVIAIEAIVRVELV